MTDRKALFVATRKAREALHETLKKIFAATPDFASSLGLDPSFTFEIHELRRCLRIGPDDQHRPQIITALTQTRPLAVEGSAQPQIFRGGSMLVVDLSKPAIEYKITKRIDSATRQQRTAAFLRDTLADPLQRCCSYPIEMSHLRCCTRLPTSAVFRNGFWYRFAVSHENPTGGDTA